MSQIKSGWINGFIGMLIFSASLPATRVAVVDFDPVFLTSVRASIAAILALVLLIIFRSKTPERADIFPLFIVTLGVVVGFPLLTALALQQITAAYSVVYIGLLPLSSAIFGVMRAGEKPRVAFWAFAILGSAIVVGFALSQGVGKSITGNAYMVAAIVICGLGYAEGARLSRRLGGWQVISWALVMALPIMALLAFFTRPESFMTVSLGAWIGLIYVSIFSMFIGFIFWYRGLAQGGVAAVGQLQLLQPFFGLLLASILLGEAVSLMMLFVSIAVVACVVGAFPEKVPLRFFGSEAR